MRTITAAIPRKTIISESGIDQLSFRVKGWDGVTPPHHNPLPGESVGQSRLDKPDVLLNVETVVHVAKRESRVQVAIAGGLDAFEEAAETTNETNRPAIQILLFINSPFDPVVPHRP